MQEYRTDRFTGQRSDFPRLGMHYHTCKQDTFTIFGPIQVQESKQEAEEFVNNSDPGYGLKIDYKHPRRTHGLSSRELESFTDLKEIYLIKIEKSNTVLEDHLMFHLNSIGFAPAPLYFARTVAKYLENYPDEERFKTIYFLDCIYRNDGCEKPWLSNSSKESSYKLSLMNYFYTYISEGYIPIVKRPS